MCEKHIKQNFWTDQRDNRFHKFFVFIFTRIITLLHRQLTNYLVFVDWIGVTAVVSDELSKYFQRYKTRLK